MIEEEILQKIVVSQRNDLKEKDVGVKREVLKEISLHGSHIIILSGIRRSGKSTLLRQLMKELENFYFFDFEDQQAFNFDLMDFEKLHSLFEKNFGKSENYFFDEIQNVNGWERFVRKLHDKGKKVVITGSNASLLSKELGTKLTGRHFRYEVFPFTYQEMLILFHKKTCKESFIDYIHSGGFPEFLKDQRQQLLQELFNDTITRDIVIRYGLRDTKVITSLATYLMTNTGKEFSYNKLKKLFGLGSVNTVIAYISYLEDCYLLFTVPRFDYSYKKQLINPKKVYGIDSGLGKAISASYSEDLGRILENLVFLHLRRKYKEIFYYKGQAECDFVIKERGQITQAIQVCYSLSSTNLDRELGGLKEAMKKFHLKEGLLITLDGKDKFENIAVVPVWKWMID